LAFYDFPAEHWVHLRTTNPIESTFGTIRRRTDQVTTGRDVTRTTMLAFAYKLGMCAERRWKRISGVTQLSKLIEGVHFSRPVGTVETSVGIAA